MGIISSCTSSPELTEEQEQAKVDKAARLKAKVVSERLDAMIKTREEEAANVKKLLLLGPGGSGKSTIVKQMITIYGKGFSEAKRKQFKRMIHQIMIRDMKKLCLNSKRICPVGKENESACEWMISSVMDHMPIDTRIGTLMQQLWTDPSIQTTFKDRTFYGQLEDCAHYFYNRLPWIMMGDYIPSEEDVLRLRVPTTGIVEHLFCIEDTEFKIVDVGGQRSERKKWIHCFEGVHAVLYIASLSAYHQVLKEDGKTNCVREALTLFEEISESTWFKNSAVILFLNKRDLFAENLEHMPLKDFFPKFNGGNTYEEGVDFFQDMFENVLIKRNMGSYMHITCATDSNNVFAVFNSVKDLMLRRAIERFGLTEFS